MLDTFLAIYAESPWTALMWLSFMPAEDQTAVLDGALQVYPEDPILLGAIGGA